VDAWSWLAEAAADRDRRGLIRRGTARGPGPDEVLDLASNDHLGLARDPRVIDAGIAALRAYGAGATGSRLVTGTTHLHEQLERALAEHGQAEAALVFSSGYLANLGVVCALAGPGDLIVADADNHASLVDACRLSRAQVVVAPHARPEAVERALREHPHRRGLVVTDAVFSVDGAAAPLVALHEVVRAGGALLLVDEAHALGVVGHHGAGLVPECGLAGQPDVVRTVTLSKALGGQGGAVLGSTALRCHLVDTARSFIFDTGLTPASCATALAALRLVTPALVASLRQVVDELADRLGVGRSTGAVVRVPIGEAHGAVSAQQSCLAEGVRVGCFRPPSVPEGGSCLRLAARADLSAADVERAANVVRRAAAAPTSSAGGPP